MPASLFPAFVRVEYQSANAPHVMIIPTTQWNDPGDGTDGTFDDHLGGAIAADTMVQALVDELAKFFTSGASFTSYTIYTLATTLADPQPRFTEQLTQVGVSISTSWQKAVQLTVTARTTLFQLAKLVLLDAASENTWDRITALPGSGNVFDLWAEWSATTNGWSARGGGRPAAFLQVSKTLNEKLRRQYHML